MDKNALADVGVIAQGLKHQVRMGVNWADLSPAAKEALDQICTSIARIVSGDQPHWETIASYAQAARPEPPLELEREMRRLVREIPKAASDA